jgi:hypothetical protein
MQEQAADYLLSRAKKYRALKEAIDEGMADVEAGRVVSLEFGRIPGVGSRAKEAVEIALRLVVSLRARSDILSIHSYLAERSPAVADRMLGRFSQRFDELCDFPMRSLSTI